MAVRVEGSAKESPAVPVPPAESFASAAASDAKSSASFPVSAAPSSASLPVSPAPSSASLPVSPAPSSASLPVSAAPSSASLPVYPVFLRLEGRRVLLVGGGRVAAAKLPALIEGGAHVTVVAPVIAAELKHAGVAVVERAFEPADLDGVSFVVAAAPPEVNRAVAVAAEARGLFVNAVDDAASASALLGGVVRRGGVTVAVSTGGRAPALAGLLREALEAVLPDDLEAWVSLGERVRAQWKKRGIAMRDRRPLLLHALQDLYATKEAP